MRIGLVTGEYPPMQGGIGANTRVLAQTLVTQGHKVFILSSTLAQETNPQLHLSPLINKWGIGSLSILSQWISDNRLDVVNFHYQTAAFGMSPWIHFIPDVIRTVPVVTTFHDLRFPYLFPKAGALRDWIVMHLASRSDGVIATNHEDMQRLSHLPHAALIPIGSSILEPVPDDFDAHTWRTLAGAADSDLLIAFFGLINHTKGLDVLLDTLAALRAGDIPARLLIIGGSAGSSDPTNAAYSREIQAQISRLQLAPYIHSTDFLDEPSVGKFLTAADVVVLPFTDGASYRRSSLMATIRYGTAIVTTRPIVDIPAFVDGENMLLVPAGNQDSLVEAITRIYQSPETGKILKHGAQQLANEFEWVQISRTTSAFFERVIGAQS